MARVESLVKGKVGNMVLYQRGKRVFVRSLPQDFPVVATPAQQASRNRLVVATRFYQQLKGTPLPALWRLAAAETRRNGYNLFMKMNIYAFNERTLADPEQLLLALGVLPRMQRLSVAYVEGNRVALAWENSLSVDDGYEGDLLQVVALFEGRMYSPRWIDTGGACRGRKAALLDLGREWRRPVHLYCFFAAPCGKAYSSSTHICVKPEGYL